MKLSNTVIFLFCIGIFSRSIGQNLFTSIDSALISCYPFSGNANDMSGNGYNGVVNNATLVPDRFNNPNSAYQFNGTSSVNIIVPGFSSALNGNGVSVSFWTTKTSYDTRSAFLMLPDDASNRLNISVYYCCNLGNVYWDYGDINSNGRLYYPYSTLPALNVWDHWVVVSSSTENYMKIYKNGSLQATKSSSSGFTTTPVRDLAIGGGIGVGNTQLSYDGKLDDIRIYKRVLLPSEVAILSAGFTCSQCPVANTATNITVSNTACAGSSITLNAAGTPSLYWFPSFSGTTTIGSGTTIITPTNTVAGPNSYFVRSFNGCGWSAPAAVQFTIDPKPPIQIVTPSVNVCVGQSAQLTPTGAVTYTWLPSNTQTAVITVTPSGTTIYSISGTGPTGCTASTAITLFSAAYPTISISAGSNLVCAGSSMNIISTGAFTHTWSTGANTSSIVVSPTVATTYSVIGNSPYNCSATASVSIIVVQPPSITVSSTSTFVCVGNAAIIGASGTPFYTWSNGSFAASVTVSPTVTTVYTVNGYDNNGCSDSKQFTLTVGNRPTVSVAGNTLVCNNSNTNIYASGNAASYLWNTGSNSQTISVVPNGLTVYTLSGTAANGCVTQTTFIIAVKQQPTVTAITSKDSICLGEAVSLSGYGAVSYSWSSGVTGNQPFTPSSSNTYTLTGAGGNGCENNAFVTVVVNPLPVLNISTSRDTICIGENAILNVIGADTYYWNNALSSASISITTFVSTLYHVVGSNAVTGCTNTASKFLVVSQCTGIKNLISESNSILIYPNPNKGRFNMSAAMPVEVSISNSLAMIVYECRIDGVAEINMENYSAGIYFVKVTESGNTNIYRIVIE